MQQAALDLSSTKGIWQPWSRLGRMGREAKWGGLEGGLVKWARDKSHTKCRLPPKQLVCNQRQSSLLSGQFDFHFSNEAFIFGLITGPAKLKLAARQSTDNSRLRRRSCEQPFLSLRSSPHPLSLLSKTGKEEMREGEREKKGLILVTIRGGWEGKKGSLKLKGRRKGRGAGAKKKIE